MSDGRVVGAQDVYKGKFDGSTFFTADNLRYKYSPLTCFEERGGWRYPAFDRCFYKQSPDADNTEWFVTSDIERILFLNEEENDELNYFQSTDFNAGVIYGMIEKEIGKLFSNTSIKCIEKEIRLPKIQVVLEGAMCPTDILDTTMTTVLEHFAAVYGNHFDIEVRHYDDVNHKQYIVFNVQVTRKEPVKEMTVAEIEEALGYKIKVVGDKV
jgi:hypothetical protein